MSASPGPSGRSPTSSPPEALLDAAFRVFAVRGYRATRLEEVAEEAGLTKGAIYYHFEGKEDLLRRAVRHRHHAIFAEIEREVAGMRAPVSVKVRHALRRFWRHLLEPEWGHAFRLMFGEVGVEFPALFRMWAEEGPVRGWSVVRDLVEEGVATGEMRPDVDPEVAARLAISGLMLQSALQVHSDLDELAPCDIDRIFDSSVELLLRGLTAPGTGPGEGRHEPGPLRPLGRVENDHSEPTDPDTLKSAVSRIVMDPELADGLVGLEPGSRLLVLFRFHRAPADAPLLQHPRGDTDRPERGVFALRSPHRPNALGATVVELLSREGNVLAVRGLDALDGSPVLDLKPE